MLGLRVRKGTMRFGRDVQSDMERKAVIWSHDRAKSCVGICICLLVYVPTISTYIYVNGG